MQKLTINKHNSMNFKIIMLRTASVLCNSIDMEVQDRKVIYSDRRPRPRGWVMGKRMGIPVCMARMRGQLHSVYARTPSSTPLVSAQHLSPSCPPPVRTPSPGAHCWGCSSSHQGGELGAEAQGPRTQERTEPLILSQRLLCCGDSRQDPAVRCGFHSSTCTPAHRPGSDPEPVSYPKNSPPGGCRRPGGRRGGHKGPGSRRL